jgi:hypothetical protein
MLSFFFIAMGVLHGAQPEAGVPVHVVITAEPHHEKEAPPLNNGDVSIHLGKERIAAKEVLPLQGEHAGLQVAIVIDDGADSELSLQFADLRKFIQSQPASTQFGVYYMRNGAAVATQKMSADHDAAAKSFRLPLGEPGGSGDPYDSLKDLVKNWPKTTDRREVLMISSGVGLYRGFPTNNPYLESAIAECQREGVQVHSIYFHGAGHMSHDYYLINYGRESLSYLGDETGGECYWQGLSTTTSFQPYLKDLGERLTRQYLVTFFTQPGKKAELQPVKYRTEVANVELIGAEKVPVPAR